jgi:hypothetical protein
MAIAFPRSIRALGSDRFRPTRATSLISAALALAWLGWFWLAPIPVYESSSLLQFGRNGMVEAAFSTQILPRLAPGQAATLRVDAPGESAASYTGQVLRINTEEARGELNVTLYFEALFPPPPEAQGTVQVQVSATTPVAFIWKTIRERGALPAPFSPTSTPAP